MENSINICYKKSAPYILSAAIHIAIILIILLISYKNYRYVKLLSSIEAAHDVLIDSISMSNDDSYREVEIKHGAASERGPYGLNDSAGRELFECARSGISVTPENFLEYAKAHHLRKGFHITPTIKNYGSVSFSTGIDHKLKTDFQECYEKACRMIEFHEKGRAAPEDASYGFTFAAQDYLGGKRAVRTWRTLWMVPKPATTVDKIALVRLLRRLHAYSLEREDAGYEHLREALNTLISIIPDDLKFPVLRAK